jgi:plastocyanin
MWLLVGFAAAIVAFLLIFEDDQGAGEIVSPSPVEPVPTSPGAAPVVNVRMVPTIQFDTDEITVGEGEVTVRADNVDDSITHNWAAYTSREEAEGGSDPIAATELCRAPCVDDVTFATPSLGTYFFRCDVHPQQMVGDFIVE